MKKKVFSLMMTLLLGFFGLAQAQQSLPFTEGFENGIGSWTMSNCHSSTGVTTTSSYVHEGSAAFAFHWYTQPPQYLISPELAGAEEGLDVEFFYYATSSYYDETFQVGYSTTTNDVNSFTFEDEVTATYADGWGTYTTSFPAGTKYVAVKCTSNDAFYLSVDDFSFTAGEGGDEPGEPTFEDNLHVKYVNAEGEEVIDTLDLGVRPAGAWMEPFTFTMYTDGPDYTVTVLDFTPSDGMFSVEGEELPFEVAPNADVELTMGTNSTAAGIIERQFVAITEGDRAAHIWPVRVELYTPECPDVVEVAYELNEGEPLEAGFSYEGIPSEITPTELHNDYTLPFPEIPEGVDGVYKFTVENDVIINAWVDSTAENGKVALYKQEGEELPHPMADNNYQGLNDDGGSAAAPFEVQIGEGTSTFSYFPFYTLYNYSIAENLFTAAELEGAGVTTAPMTSLSWYATNTTGYAQQGITIWMANVDDAALTTTSHPVTNMTKVYTGAMTPAVGWNEFVFNEGNFAWDGHSNVLIYCQRNNGAWNSTVNWQATASMPFNASSYRYQDSEAYDATVANPMYTSTTRPNIIMKSTGRNRDAITYDFEDGLDGWTVIDVNADGGTWVHSDENPGGYDYTEVAHGGSGFAMCYSFVDYDGAYDTDSYLVSPQKYAVDNNSTITFWADNANDDYPESFSVCVATAAQPTAADFTEVWSGAAKGNGPAGKSVRHMNNRYDNWREHTVSLSAYAGQEVWIAFHDVNYDAYEVWIDDVTVNAASTTPDPTPTPEPTPGPTPTPGSGEALSISAGPVIENLGLTAGTYYLVASATQADYTVYINVDEMPCPAVEAEGFAFSPVPADNEDGLEPASVTLQWMVPEYATGWRLVFGSTYHPQVGHPQTIIYPEDGSWSTDMVNSYTVRNLWNNTNYFWHVEFNNGACPEGVSSPIWGFTTHLNIPQNLRASDETIFEGETVTLTWNAVVDRTYRYYFIYKDDVKIGETTVNQIGQTTYTVPASELSYNMNGYRFYVTAVYDEGESDPSNTVVVKVSGYSNTTGINGYAYEQDGETPIEGVNVTITGTDEFGDEHVYTATTDENGYYHVQVYVGNYTMAVANKEGYQTTVTNHELPFDVALNGQVDNVNFIMDENFVAPAHVCAELVEVDGEELVKVWWDFDFYNALIEDFETGDLSKFDWVNSASYPWTVVTTSPYEGTYCLKSGGAGVASVQSDLSVTVDVPNDGKISFYIKPSCEQNWDYGYFYIDGTQKGSFTGAGSWAEKKYDITAGEHTFKWSYQKDGSVNANDDCVYLDYIQFNVLPDPPVVGNDYNFDNGLQGWTNIDADGDGYIWVSSADPGAYHNAGVSLSGLGHNDSEAFVISGSYSNASGMALHPDNYLVSPQVQLGGMVKFYAQAQDVNYAAEHFGLAVSTTSNTDASAFTTVQEWTMTAKNAGPKNGVRAVRAGEWYEYTVDLSAYSGMGYVAIRHFNCTDQFILNVDDITIGDPAKGGDRALNHYNIYRTDCYNDGPYNDTTTLFLATVWRPDTAYFDVSWPDAAPGVYKWGVSSVYAGNRVVDYPAEPRESDIVWSNMCSPCIDKDMTIDSLVSVNVLLNSADSPEGTVVTFTNLNEGEQAAHPMDPITLDATGFYRFPSFRKGDYTVTVEHDGYETITDTPVSIWEPVDLRYVMIEILYGIDNLYVSRTGWAMWDAQGDAPTPVDPDDPQGETTLSEGFESASGQGLPTGWTMIDADGDGNNWYTLNWIDAGWDETGAHTGDQWATSASYNGTGLHPDNYLVSPQVTLGGTLSFWASAQDPSYAAETFGVAVSTSGNTNASDFTTIQSWTMTAKGLGARTPDTRSGNNRIGNYYQYTVDLSAYAGQTGYVAIRHYNTYDMFRLNVDDIEMTASRAGDRHLEYFKVMCESIDHEPIFNANTTHNFCQVATDQLVEGEQYICKVAAVYSTGQGPWSEVVWQYESCENYAGTVDGVTVEGNTVSWTYPGGDGPTPPPTGDDNFTEGFENGLNGWTVLTVNADGGEWVHSSNNPGGYDYASHAHGGSGFAMCYSFIDYDGAYNTDSYLITPQKYAITNGSTLTFWADNANDSYPESFKVCVATADNPGASDFTQVWSGNAKESGAKANVRHDANRYDNWRSHSIDLSAYAGQNVYIAFHDVNYDMYEVWIDDVALTAGAKSGNMNADNAPVAHNTTVHGRNAWDLMFTFTAPEAAQYGVVTDGNNFYTSNWGYSSAAHNFYKYDMEGNMIEGFEISGCGTLRGMTYDGTNFYGVANSSTVYCVDLANHSVVNTFTSSYGAMRGITYDPVRDGFWVIGNWSGSLTLIDRTGAIVQVGPTPASVSDLAYYKDENDVEHVFCFNNADNGVYDYNITTNTLGSSVFNFSNVPGFDSGSSGGCHVASINGKMAFIGDMQQDPNLIGVYELRDDNSGPDPIEPTGNILGAMIFVDGEWEAFVPAPTNTYTYEGEGENICVRMVYDGEAELPDNNFYYAMSCEECAELNPEPACAPVENLTGYYQNDPEYGEAIFVEWDEPEGVVSYELYIGGELAGTLEPGGLPLVIYGLEGYPAMTLPIGVVAVYDDCESEMVEVNVNYDEVPENNLEVALFPNPTKDNVTIQAAGMNHITVMSVLGQVVYDAEVSSDEVILNMSQFNAGVYVVRIVTANGVGTRRVTVVK